jgi:hypothetical protein
MLPIMPLFSNRSRRRCLVAVLCLAGMHLAGSPSELPPAALGHAFFVDHRGAPCRIIDADTRKVTIRLPGGGQRSLRPTQYGFTMRAMPCAGRVTVYASGAETGQQVEAESLATLTTVSETRIAFRLLADRDIPKAWVAMFNFKAGATEPTFITFGSLDDLPAGRVVTREVVFRGQFKGVTRYAFELYAGEEVLEKHFLHAVAEDPSSGSLLIPWEDRLDAFRRNARREIRTAPAKPFETGFVHFDAAAARARGVLDLTVPLAVGVDGLLSLRAVPAELSPAEGEALRADVAAWKYFPAVKGGTPRASEADHSVAL